MTFDATPRPGDGERAAIAWVLERLRPDSRPSAYRSPWRLAALEENRERGEPTTRDRPRSIRRATRA